MRRLPSIEDDMQRLATYELNDGTRVRFDARDVEEVGAAELLRRMGLGEQLPHGRRAVIQDGHMVGTLPAEFDPSVPQSGSAFYDMRPGDFRLEGDRWIASSALGMGDLHAVPGFVPS